MSQSKFYRYLPLIPRKRKECDANDNNFLLAKYSKETQFMFPGAS